MTKKLLRCAIYTRKSSEEGLDQEFNSLHAQREACEAYVKSQVGEGWWALATAYDDGGVSGGTMERDGLKALLADIQAGKVDVVVVYKVDRLTRSLHDFARIVEVFDKHQVSFVSVTQAFNTTTSMGRLTLNVLLSFAQFEREVTGERIRDKIAASKAKGLWMGGNPPLGYDPKDRTLVINETEAETVRHIFRRYLEVGSVNELHEELAREGLRSKSRLTRDGRQVGGKLIGRGPLLHLLRNPVYLGCITHKRVTHPGIHPAILDNELFEAVQAKLDGARVVRTATARQTSPLTGIIFDGEGNRMSPTHGRGKGGKRYRYYVSAPLQQGGKVRPDTLGRLPASATEDWVRDQLRRLFPCHDGQTALARLEVRPASVHLAIDPSHLSQKISDLLDAESRLIAALNDGEEFEDDGTLWWVRIDRQLRFRGGRAWIEGAAQAPRRFDATLARALKSAHRIARAHASPTALLERSPTNPYERVLVTMAFLSPDLQVAILEGSQPARWQLEQLMAGAVPFAWADQHRAFP